MSKVNPIPEGFHTVTPHLIIKGADKAIEFYKKAFGAEEVCRMPAPDGSVMHAEIRIGSSRVMLAEENAEWFCFGPKESSPVTIHLYVPDCDAAMKRAQGAGATVTMPAENMFWGDRFGKLKDPFGHHWSIATHTSDPTPEEMKKAMAAMCGGG
jgi:uncharacterized glyoxalase superfamily protein PhnB